MMEHKGYQKMSFWTVLSSHWGIPVEGLTRDRTAAHEQRCEARISRVPCQTFIYFYGFSFQSGALIRSTKLWRGPPICQSITAMKRQIQSCSWTRNASTSCCNAVNESNPTRLEELVALCVSQMTISSLSVKYYTIFFFYLSVWDVQRIKNCKNQRPTLLQTVFVHQIYNSKIILLGHCSLQRMPTLCVWSACRVPYISAFSVSSYATALARTLVHPVSPYPLRTCRNPFARSVRHFMQHVSFDKDLADFVTSKHGSIRFSILITKATAIILTFRYSTQCTEAACLNITCRQSLRISQSSSQVPSIKLLRTSLAFAILLHAYALPISQFLISDRMQENQALKRIFRSGSVK
jgi:hypothetical protein